MTTATGTHIKGTLIHEYVEADGTVKIIDYTEGKLK